MTQDDKIFISMLLATLTVIVLAPLSIAWISWVYGELAQQHGGVATLVAAAFLALIFFGWQACFKIFAKLLDRLP